MQSKLLIAVLCGLALVAAALVWFSATPGATPSEPALIGARPAPADTRSGTPPDGAADLLRGASDQAQSGASERASASLERSTPVQGERARLVGRVVDERGRPVAEARVILAAGTFWNSVPLDMERKGRGRSWSTRAEATTNARGEFASAAELRAGRLRVAVRARGFAPRYVEHWTLPPEGRLDLGDIELRRGAVLAGRVLDRLGQPVAGAQLLQAVERGVAGFEITIEGRGVPLTQSGAEGEFRIDCLALGPYRILVDAPGYQVAELSGATSAPGEEQVGLEVIVDAGELLTGKIVGAPSEFLARVALEASPGVDPEQADPAAPAPPHPRPRPGSIAADGSFEIAGLAPASQYSVYVLEPQSDGRLRRSRAVERKLAFSGARGIELLYRAEATLVFQVVDRASGKPVEDFVAWAGLGDSFATFSDDDGDVVRSFPEGRARIGGLRSGDTEATARLALRAVGYADFLREGIELAAGSEVDLGTIALEPGPVLRVRALDAVTRAPVAGARVYLAPEGDRALTWVDSAQDKDMWGSRGLRFGRTDAQGIARLPGFDGPAALRVLSDEHAAAGPLALRLTEREQQLDVELIRGGVVEIQVVSEVGAPLSGVAIEKKRLGEDARDPANLASVFAGRGRVTDENGILRFDQLARGDWGFRVQDESRGSLAVMLRGDDGGNWTPVLVDPGEVVRLALTARARAQLAGVVTEASVPLAGCALQLLAKENAKAGGTMTLGVDARYRATSDHRGRFQFEDIVTGDYWVNVAHPERTMDREFEVQVAPGAADVAFELDVSVVSGRVTDAAGQPLEGARVRAVLEDRSRVHFLGARSDTALRDDGEGNLRRSSSGRRSETFTDSSGRYRLRGVLPETALTIYAERDFYTTDSVRGIRVEHDEEVEDVDLQLELGGKLTVRVAVGSGQDERGSYYARIYPDGDAPSQERAQTVTIWGSKERSRTLSEGRWKLELTRRADGQTRIVAERAFEIRLGEETSLEFQL